MKAKQQVRLDIKSNAGGTGKTTLAVHLAYAIARQGFKVVIFEFDPQGSLKQFTGLGEESEETNIATHLLNSKLTTWSLTPIWEKRISGVFAIQGGAFLEEKVKDIQNHPQGNFLLKNKLKKLPLDADLIIYDNPASTSLFGLMTLAAATHVVVPMQCEPKAADGAASLLSWFYEKIDTLDLENPPEILGFVPSRLDKSISAHREISEQLPEILTSLEVPIQCFPPIRNSNEFLNASKIGLPLHLYRPGHAAIKDFDPIVNEITKIMKR
jgi:chromosome partitioning protein